MGDNGPEKPTLFGHEWGLICPCGERINLEGVTAGVPPEDIEYDNYPYYTERIRSIEGERTFDCYNCPRELTVSIDETGIAKWEAPDD